MAALVSLYLEPLIAFALILARVSGLLAVVPVLGVAHVPMRVRALLAIAITAMILPLYWNAPAAAADTLLHLAVLVAAELVLGLALGIGVAILFSGLQIAGQVVGQMSGMYLANVFDPAFESEVPMFAQLLNWVALVVFVLIGGHRMVMHALLDTFRWTPPGEATFSTDLVALLTGIVAQSFQLGIRAAAPAMVALLMSILVMGLISRTLPQLNVLAVGFSLNSMMVLAMLSLSLGSIVWVFQEQVEPTVNAIRETLIEIPGY